MNIPLRLSPREIEVLRWLAQGEGPKQIAHRLRITVRTCEHYVASARRKLGARNSTHAVAIAMAAGMLASQLVEGTFIDH